MSDWEIEIIYTKGDWPWPYYWQVRRKGSYVSGRSGISFTERAARRRAERYARRHTQKCTEYSFTVEES